MDRRRRARRPQPGSHLGRRSDVSASSVTTRSPGFAGADTSLRSQHKATHSCKRGTSIAPAGSQSQRANHSVMARVECSRLAVRMNPWPSSGYKM